MKFNAEDVRVARWWAKRNNMTVNAVIAQSLWAYLLPVRGDAS